MEPLDGYYISVEYLNLIPGGIFCNQYWCVWLQKPTAVRTTPLGLNILTYDSDMNDEQ